MPLPATETLKIDGPLVDYFEAKVMAELLSMHPTTLAKWRMARKGPPFTKIGRRVYYYVPSVRQWLANNQITPVRG